MTGKKINGPFAARTIEMLKSPAMRVLSLASRRILDRIEIELAKHGGKDNGVLPVTYGNFRAFGIHQNAISPGIRELAALGLIEITERGCSGNGAHRAPNKFRLSYHSTAHAPATNEWKTITSIEQAEPIARAARDATALERRVKKAANVIRTKQFASIGKRTREAQFLGNSPVSENVPLSRRRSSHLPREAAKTAPSPQVAHQPRQPRKRRRRTGGAQPR